MTNDGLQQRIEFERQKSIDDVDQVTALATIGRGGRVQARFKFDLISEGEVTGYLPDNYISNISRSPFPVRVVGSLLGFTSSIFFDSSPTFG
jgi:hypothetical protein